MASPLPRRLILPQQYRSILFELAKSSPVKNCVLRFLLHWRPTAKIWYSLKLINIQLRNAVHSSDESQKIRT